MAYRRRFVSIKLSGIKLPTLTVITRKWQEPGSDNTKRVRNWLTQHAHGASTPTTAVEIENNKI